MRNIAVIGTGYVGLVTGACFAEAGNHVICYDVNAGRIADLNEGIVPFHEPGLPDLIDRNRQRERLHFSIDLPETVQRSDILYITVGTPMAPSGDVDLTQVGQAVESVAKTMQGYKMIVLKSTVPAGTARKAQATIPQFTSHPFDVVSHPEFLREGTAVRDFLNPERTVIGAESRQAADVIEEIAAPFGGHVVRTGWETAELIKYASNAYLAMKISFINNMAGLCDKLGADVTDLALGVGLDSRIGTEYLHAGIGYGGSCFPKDTQALLQMAEHAGHDFEMLKWVIGTNGEQPRRFIDKVKKKMGDLRGLTVAVLGLSFKPGTGDMRSAPSIPIIRSLLEAGASVRAYDPAAIQEARRLLGDEPYYTGNLEEAVEGCDACIIVTEWPDVVNADLQRLRALMKHPVIFDGRNLFSLTDMRQAGFDYHSIGRPSVAGSLNSAR